MMLIIRVSSDGQTDKTIPTSSEQPPVTKSLKSSNSSESKLNKPSSKRKLQSEGKNSEKKKAKLQSTEMRTAFEYDGIGVCNEETSTPNKEEKILSNNVICVCLTPTAYFLVPSWRTCSPTPNQNTKVKGEVKSEV